MLGHGCTGRSMPTSEATASRPEHSQGMAMPVTAQNGLRMHQLWSPRANDSTNTSLRHVRDSQAVNGCTQGRGAKSGPWPRMCPTLHIAVSPQRGPYSKIGFLGNVDVHPNPLHCAKEWSYQPSCASVVAQQKSTEAKQSGRARLSLATRILFMYTSTWAYIPAPGPRSGERDIAVKVAALGNTTKISGTTAPTFGLRQVRAC